MTRVRIEMKGDTQHLTASGSIFVSPWRNTSLPVIAGAVVRRTFAWSGELAPDTYVYKYGLGNGGAKYTFQLFVDGENTPREDSGERDGMNQVGNQWRFEVPDSSEQGDGQ